MASVPNWPPSPLQNIAFAQLPDGRLFAASDKNMLAFRYDALSGFTVLRETAIATYHQFDCLQPIGADKLLMRDHDQVNVLQVLPDSFVVYLSYFITPPDTVTEYEARSYYTSLTLPAFASPDRFFWFSSAGRLESVALVENQIEVRDSTPLPNYAANVAIQDGTMFIYRFMETEPAPLKRTYLRLSKAYPRLGAALGVALADAEAGETVPVSMEGIVSGYSGLMPGESYYGTMYNFSGQSEGAESYLLEDGTPTIRKTENPIGRAISDTEMLLRIR